MASPSFNNLKKTLPKLTTLISGNGTFADQMEYIADGTIDIFIQPLGAEDIATLDGGAFSEPYKGYVDTTAVISEGDRIIDGNFIYEVKDIQEWQFTQVPSFPHKKLFLERLTDVDQY